MGYIIRVIGADLTVKICAHLLEREPGEYVIKGCFKMAKPCPFPECLYELICWFLYRGGEGI